MTQLYQVEATALGGRSGAVATSDGQYRFELTEGRRGDAPSCGANPEQLLAAGYAACLLSAIKSAASERDVKLSVDANVTVRIGLRRPRADRADLDFDFHVGVDLPDLPEPFAKEIVAVAHDRCPFSRALRNPTPVRTSVA